MNKRMIVALCALAFATGAYAESDSHAPAMVPSGTFLTGCNYWASHAGMYMWRRWDGAQVEKDVSALAAHGVNVMRVFPLWPDFQPLTRLLGGGGQDRGLAQNDGPLQNEAGVDEEMMRRFRFLCDVAERNRVKLVVGLVTGWMSGRLFVPPAFESKNVLSDPEVMKWQVRFVRRFVRTFRSHPAVIGWDLGNECNCMAWEGMNENHAWMWMNTIASAIRLEDATRPVVSGMHSLPNPTRSMWNLRDQGELMDVLTTHPYPLFTPHCAVNDFDTMRSECHPAAESLLYANLSGRPCFVEEAGDLGRGTASPERAAANMLTAMATSWASGLSAYVWWCGFDQQHLNFPPYTWNAIERELGLFTKDFEPKPALKTMAGFRRFLDALPADVRALPARKVEAVVIVSDREKAWPQAFGAYLLAKQAGFEITYAYADRPLPAARLYILPHGDGVDPYGYETWQAVTAAAERGATVLVSRGNRTRYSGFREATGAVIDAFRTEASSGEFTLADWPGRVIRWNDSTTTRLKAQDCEVLAASRGTPMFTAKRLGKGMFLCCNFPLEATSVFRGDCFAGANPNPRYLIYRKAARIAGLTSVVDKGLVPALGITEHPAANGRTLVVAVNYEPAPCTAPLALKGSLGKVWRGSFEGATLKLAANDFAVFEVLPANDHFSRDTLAANGSDIRLR